MAVTETIDDAASDAADDVAKNAASVQMDGFRETLQQDIDENVRDGSGLITRLGQSIDVVGVMLTITIAAVVGYVGLLVMSDTESSAEFTDGSEFDNASQSLTDGISTSFGLVEVVFIVLMLAVIITVLVGLRR